MRKLVGVLAVSAVMFIGFAAAVAQNRAGKIASGQIVIVLKDGHRRSFNLSDVARIEFPGGSAIADIGPTPPGAPPRGHYVGKWEVGDGSGGTFYITLNDDGSAWRTLHRLHGRWAYVNGEARVTWDDGAQDAIRKVGGHDRKFAYSAGKSFTDQPDNEGEARNTTHRPI
jgi:hypothetical protein